MPYKYPEDKWWKIPKQKYKLTNWSKYNNALKDRGRIDFWLDKEAIDKLVRRRSGEYWIWGSYAIH